MRLRPAVDLVDVPADLCHLEVMSKSLDLREFLATAELADLGPGPRVGVESQRSLENRLPAILFASGLTHEQQELIRALILLWHDHLDAAHGIAQGVDGADGAFVHGIMHRREPDFSNAGYWFRRVGQHPAFAQIALKARPVLEAGSEPGFANRLIRKGVWDPFAFIDACEEASKTPEEEPQRMLQEVQREEFLGLLDWLRGA
jgi:hypothetical protein